MYCDVQLNPDWWREILWTHGMYHRFLVLRMLQRCLVTSVIGQHAGTKLNEAWLWLSAKDWFGHFVSILCPKWTAQDSQMLHSLVGFKVHEALPSPGSLYLEGWICWCSSCLRFWLIASQDFPQHLMFFRLKVCHQLDCIHPMMSFARLRGKGVDFHSPDISRCSILWYCLLRWSSLASSGKLSTSAKTLALAVFASRRVQIEESEQTASIQVSFGYNVVMKTRVSAWSCRFAD